MVPSNNDNDVVKKQTSMDNDQSKALSSSSKTSKTSTSLCIVCLQRNRALVIVPCGHFNVCVPCGHGLSVCATCGASVNALVRIYE